MSGHEQIKIMELVKKIGKIAEGNDMQTVATALAMSLAFCIDSAGPEAKDARKYVNKIIDDTLKGAEKAKGNWGKLLGTLLQH
jgi:hypothetical protein